MVGGIWIRMERFGIDALSNERGITLSNRVSKHHEKSCVIVLISICMVL